jgi:hypothetical protein
MKTTSNVLLKKPYEFKRRAEVKFLIGNKRRMLASNREKASYDEDYWGELNGQHVRYLLLTLGAGFIIALVVYILILLFLFA